MARRDNTSGPVIKWLDYGVEGWKPCSYDTIKEALEDHNYGNNFLITRLVDWDTIEK